MKPLSSRQVLRLVPPHPYSYNDLTTVCFILKSQHLICVPLPWDATIQLLEWWAWLCLEQQDCLVQPWVLAGVPQAHFYLLQCSLVELLVSVWCGVGPLSLEYIFQRRPCLCICWRKHQIGDHELLQVEVVWHRGFRGPLRFYTIHIKVSDVYNFIFWPKFGGGKIRTSNLPSNSWRIRPQDHGVLPRPDNFIVFTVG